MERRERRLCDVEKEGRSPALTVMPNRGSISSQCGTFPPTYLLSMSAGFWRDIGR